MGANGASAATARLTPLQRLEGIGGRALGRLPSSLQRRLAGGEPVVIDGQTLHPQLQLVGRLRRLRTPYRISEPTPAIARARFQREMRIFRGRRTPVRAVRDLVIDGDGGALRLRHYAPFDADARSRPLLVFLHGGGWVIGDIETHDEPCRILCRDAGIHVLSLDYRLAPEHPFPAGLDDVVTALRWACANASSLGAAPGRVSVGGDSAGGNLAAVCSVLARREECAPLAQLLIYPATDAVTPRPSHALFAEGFILTRYDRETFSRHYYGASAVDRADPRISPLHAREHDGLPPALVVTAGFDPLRDEGEAYADALQRAGTPVHSYREASLEHGFANLTGIVPAARGATARIAREWRALLDGLAVRSA